MQQLQRQNTRDDTTRCSVGQIQHQRPIPLNQLHPPFGPYPCPQCTHHRQGHLTPVHIVFKLVDFVLGYNFGGFGGFDGFDGFDGCGGCGGVGQICIAFDFHQHIPQCRILVRVQQMNIPRLLGPSGVHYTHRMKMQLQRLHHFTLTQRTLP